MQEFVSLWLTNYKLNIEIQFYLFIYLFKLIILIEDHYYIPSFFFSKSNSTCWLVGWFYGV